MFNQGDWTADVDVAQVGSITPDQAKHHAHSDNASHYLVRLGTDSDGLVSWLSISDAIAHERSLDHLNAIDVLVAPDVAEFSAQAFDQAEQLIERGRRAADEVLPRIRSLLQQEE